MLRRLLCFIGLHRLTYVLHGKVLYCVCVEKQCNYVKKKLGAT